MKIFRGFPPYPSAPAPAQSIAIGNFDGVHRGHQTVIDAARAGALADGHALGVMTFEPHPRQVFRPDDPPFRLTPEAVKARKLERLGVDTLVVLPFNAELSNLSPEAFAHDILAKGVHAKRVSVGRDFRFGKERAGDVAALERFGAAYGFAVTVVDKIGDDGADDDAPFSSSAARAALREGRPADAAAILGDWQRIDGVVERGDQRGRDLGFPTANLPMTDILHPAYGVYAVRVDVVDGPHRGVYDGVASLGVRPTFNKTVANFETFIFDFAGDLYGAHLSVALIAFLRPEWKFDSLDALIAQMDQDVLDAKDALATATAAPDPWT